MASVGYATLDIIPSMKGIESKLQSGLSGPMTSTGTKAGQTLGTSTKRSFLAGVAGIGTSLAGLLIVQKSVAFLKDSIAQARESQKVTAQTRAVIKSTGGVANVTAKQIGNLANAISLKTGIDDEEIQSSENMLLTFKNVHNEVGKGNDIFNQATQTVTDMSAALGQDAKSSAIQLGKALNDPVKGITALSRVGVTFDDQQKAQITTLVAHNNLLGAQKIILKELTSEFGGSAAAQATAGDKLKVAWENMQEALGKVLLPELDKLEIWFTKKGIPVIMQGVRWFKRDGVDAFKSFGKEAIGVVQDLEPLGKVLLGVVKAFSKLPDSVQKAIVLGGAVYGLNRKFGGILSVLPTFGSGMGRVATETEAAGTAAKGATSRFGGLMGGLKTLGTYAGAAVAIGGITDNVSELRLILGKGVPVQKDSVAGVMKQMQASGFSDFASQSGIDINKLATQLQQSGTKGAYVKKVMDQLTQATGGANQGFARLGGWKAGLDRLTGPLKYIGIDLSTGGKAAYDAQVKIRHLIQSLEDLRRQEQRNRATTASLTSLLTGLPKKVATKIAAPGAANTVKEVKDLAKRYNLTPKEVKTVMLAKDFATKDIKGVLGWLKVYNKQHPSSTLGADGRPAQRSFNGAFNQLDKWGRAHASATVDVNTRSAYAGILNLRQNLSNIPDQNVNIITHTVKKARGGLIYGPGTATSDSVPALLSRGEFVMRAAAVDKYGVAFMQRLNAGRFAGGGPASAPASTGIGPGDELVLVVNGQAMDAYIDTKANARIQARKRHDARLAGR